MPQSYHHIIGRYALFDEIASGGMATVHIGRLLGPVGFSRTVAIKRLHPQFAKDPEFVDMFVDEARVAARVRHPNVVPTLDVVKTEQELFLVMEYVQGESLSRLMRRARRRGRPLATRLVAPVIAGMLYGLHAAHTARGERGEMLHIVHRDVSPQNVLVGTDGVPRVFDFGIAKARGRLQTTREGQIKGKLAYMAPEQLSGGEVGPQTDVYAAAVVLWEALANQRLFDADNEALLLATVLEGAKKAPSAYNEDVPEELDAIVMRGLSMDPDERFDTAREFARELEAAVHCASASEVGEWVEELATDTLAKRADRIAEIESQSEIKAFAPGVAPESRSAQPSFPDDIADRSSQMSSQLSSITVTGGPRRERSGRTGFVIAFVSLLAGGSLAVFLLRPLTAPEPEPAPTRPVLGAPTGEESPGNAEAMIPSSAPVASSVEPASSTSAAPSASAAPKPAPPPARPPVVVPPPVPAPPRPLAPKPPPEPECSLQKVFLPDGSFTYKNVCK